MNEGNNSETRACVITKEDEYDGDIAAAASRENFSILGGGETVQGNLTLSFPVLSNPRLFFVLLITRRKRFGAIKVIEPNTYSLPASLSSRLQSWKHLSS